MAEPASSSELLGVRALNRALLARQFLLQRAEISATEAIEHLVGLQAQAPNAPYVGLWSRLASFQTGELAHLISDRAVVRAPLMRTTIHLVTARDCLTLRPLVQPVLIRGYTGTFGRNLAGIDSEALLAAAAALLEERPRTRAELGPLLHERWPGYDPVSLAYAVSYQLPLVQVPPRGIWGASGPVAWTTVEAWLGQPLASDGRPDQMLKRYLGAFGPASVRDIQTWCGLTRLREVVERLRPELCSFRDEQGTELFDLPDAPRPDPDTPAPPRFLPEYDNLLLSHADRTRVMPAGRRPPLFPGNGGNFGTFLLDGLFSGEWRLIRQRDHAVLTIEPYEPLSELEHAALAEEGARLLGFIAADAGDHEVRISDPARAI